MQLMQVLRDKRCNIPNGIYHSHSDPCNPSPITQSRRRSAKKRVCVAYSSKYNVAVLHNQHLHFPVVVAICKKDGETQPQQRCQYAIGNSSNQYMLSVHRKQTYNRNYHCPRLSHSLSSPSAITNKTHSVEVVRNYSPLHPHSPTPFLLARHRIHYHVHIIINALHSLRDNATLKNEVTTLVIIPFYGIMATIHSSSTSGDYRKLHSTLITCSRYCHSN